MPYNGSIFMLREAYDDIFKHKRFSQDTNLEDAESSKVYKICYKINLLPNLCEYIETKDGKHTTVKPK